MVYDVFISYSSIDKDIADLLCRKIEDKGMKCWCAPRDIEPGTNWASSIDKAISQTKVMVFIFTDFSNKSKQVIREVRLAVENNVTILPLKITDKNPNSELKYYLRSSQWMKAAGKEIKEEEINRLVSACEMNVHSSIDKAKVLKKRTKHDRGILIAAAAITLIAALLTVSVIKEFVPEYLGYSLESITDDKTVTAEDMIESFTANLNALDEDNNYEAVQGRDNCRLLLRNSQTVGLAVFAVSSENESGIVVFAKKTRDAVLRNNRQILAEAVFKTIYPDITDRQLKKLIRDSEIAGDGFTCLDLNDCLFEYDTSLIRGIAQIELGHFEIFSDSDYMIREIAGEEDFWNCEP